MVTTERAVRRDDLFRARLLAHQRLIDRTLRDIEAALAVMECPYVSLSGGKDSTVLLDLVRRVDPTVPAIWSDDELEYRETVAFVPAIPNVQIVSGATVHADWFTPWSDRPFWRVPLPTMQWLDGDGRLDHWSERVGYGGVFLGLRASERAHRRVHLAAHGTLNRVASGQWRANPLAWWSVDDIWAEIAARDISYNPVYDVLTQIGVPRAEQRVGPLPLAQGWHLKRGWPEMLAALERRYGPRWGRL